MSSGDIFIGGLALHRLVFRVVMVFWSGCMSLALSPLSPTISIGLSPVCMAYVVFLVDRGFLAEARIGLFFRLTVVGCLFFYRYIGFVHLILKCCNRLHP